MTIRLSGAPALFWMASCPLLILRFIPFFLLPASQLLLTPRSPSLLWSPETLLSKSRWRLSGCRKNCYSRESRIAKKTGRLDKVIMKSPEKGLKSTWFAQKIKFQEMATLYCCDFKTVLMTSTFSSATSKHEVLFLVPGKMWESLKWGQCHPENSWDPARGLAAHASHFRAGVTGILAFGPAGGALGHWVGSKKLCKSSVLYRQNEVFICLLVQHGNTACKQNMQNLREVIRGKSESLPSEKRVPPHLEVCPLLCVQWAQTTSQ